MKKMITIIVSLFLLGLLGILFYFFVGKTKIAEKITWGVNFSQKHTENLKLDWKKTYLALLEDLGVKNLKLITHWDWIEGKRGEFYSDDLDWQIREAEKRNVKLILVIGVKTGRWPEYHAPEWFYGLSREEQEKEILGFITNIVSRYRDSRALQFWQVENEPFFPFGEDTFKTNKNFLKKEIELVKSLDTKKRPIIVSDSGEFSFWVLPAQLGDIVGTTLHRKTWFAPFKAFGFYAHYPLPPVYYWRRAQLIKKIFNKEVICVELQAEPWGPALLYDMSLEEQKKTMDLEQFKENIEFAKKTGLDTFYLWGAEWWFWLKEKQNDPSIWNEAKKLFMI